MIAIVNITQARGYSGYDHLLDDRPLARMVGRRFVSPGAAARAAGRLLRGTQDHRCAHAPVLVSWDEEDGSVVSAVHWLDGRRA